MPRTPESATKAPPIIGFRAKSDDIQRAVKQIASLLPKPGQGLHRKRESDTTDLLRPMNAGEVAALRRMRSGDVGPLGFWRLVVQVLEPAKLVSPSDDGAVLEAWRVIIALMAQAAGLHNAKGKLGSALATAGCAEVRVTRALDATGKSVEPALRGLVHHLIAKSMEFNQAELARLVLSEFVQPHRGWTSAWRAVARAFYRTMSSKHEVSQA